MITVERGCFERGCACYDSRIDKDGVVVDEVSKMPKLTDEIIGDLWHQADHHLHKFARLLIKWAEDNGS